MWPHIRDGDMLAAVPLSGDETIRTGCVVVYQTSLGRLAVHRVMGRFDADTIKIRGDAAFGACERIPREEVLGRVVNRERSGRQVDMTTGPRQLEGLLIARSGVVRVTIQRWLRRLRNHRRA